MTVNLRRIFLKSLPAIVAVRSFSGFAIFLAPLFPLLLPPRARARSIFSGLCRRDHGLSWLLKGASGTRGEKGKATKRGERNRHCARRDRATMTRNNRLCDQSISSSSRKFLEGGKFFATISEDAEELRSHGEKSRIRSRRRGFLATSGSGRVHCSWKGLA